MTQSFEYIPAERVDQYDLDTIEMELTADQMLALTRAAARALPEGGEQDLTVEVDWMGAPEAAATPTAGTLPPVEVRPYIAEPPAPVEMASPPPPAEPSPTPPSRSQLVVVTSPPPPGAPTGPPFDDSRPMASSRTHWLATGIAVAALSIGGIGSVAYLATSHQPAVHATAVPPVVTEPLAPEPVAPPSPESPPPVLFKNPFDRDEIFEFSPGTADAEAREAVAALLLERARDRQVQQAQRSPADNKKPNQDTTVASTEMAQRH